MPPQCSAILLSLERAWGIIAWRNEYWKDQFRSNRRKRGYLSVFQDISIDCCNIQAVSIIMSIHGIIPSSVKPSTAPLGKSLTRL